MLKFIIEFCELAIYKNEDFHPFPIVAKSLLIFQKQCKFFFSFLCTKKEWPLQTEQEKVQTT